MSSSRGALLPGPNTIPSKWRRDGASNPGEPCGSSGFQDRSLPHPPQLTGCGGRGKAAPRPWLVAPVCSGMRGERVNQGYGCQGRSLGGVSEEGQVQRWRNARLCPLGEPTAQERQQRTPSGRYKVRIRARSAQRYLKEDGLLTKPSAGLLLISGTGWLLLAMNAPHAHRRCQERFGASLNSASTRPRLPRNRRGVGADDPRWIEPL